MQLIFNGLCNHTYFVSLQFIASLWSYFFVLFYGAIFLCIIANNKMGYKKSIDISSIDESHLHKIDNEASKKYSVEKERMKLSSRRASHKIIMHWYHSQCLAKEWNALHYTGVQLWKCREHWIKKKNMDLFFMSLCSLWTCSLVKSSC